MIVKYNRLGYLVGEGFSNVFKNKKSLVSQREVGVHTKSFEKAMKSCLREDPNIIMV